MAWEPPTRFLLNWRVNPTRPGTELEVLFAAHGDATRVELEHRGWEQAEDRTSYDEGWDVVLGKLVDAT